ncbi:hypothetical protein N0V93_009923 [Gnomoniopsis smithogilvyi]|uniref:Uncharacterized protein n=1 Tax=Gnomoniopsis smithogilvyi TaxID=1191159 RepID=A0A9W9CST0_9PEZI|nr:hypothetical protein N0V93_009923 [Gnomoniopsis smithogilvyi]
MKRVLQPWLSLLIAALAPSLAPTTFAQVTVPVYVPGYRAENWDGLAGSVITSNSVATTYTVFCPDSADCEISGPLPFTFAEGPSTFEYSGTIQDRLTALLACKLASTTAATCTEYSSFGSRFTKGNTTGPTDFSRTQTYTGSEVQWGVLTLTTPAPAAATATGTGGSGGVETVNPTDTAWFFPSPTSKSSGAASLGLRRGELLVGIAAVMMAGLGAA